MKTASNIIMVCDMAVEVVRKNIRHMHLRVRPPEGRVSLSVPRHISDDQARQLITSRLEWIYKHRQRIKNQPETPRQEFVSGERHYYQGNAYTLDVCERQGRQGVSISNDGRMLLQVLPDTSTLSRARVIDAWYRRQMKLLIPELLEKWQPIVGRQVSAWGIKKMHTRWGSCNIPRARIWLNLELVKRPVECLEYVLVHEMVHLHERLHNQRFKACMDRFLPDWREREELLVSTSLAQQYRLD